MENKHNFAGIIIPVIVAVILLTVLPIINSINSDCPPCDNIPTLYTPTISISDDTLTITPNSNNGAFVTGYKIYVDNVLLDTITSTTYDLSEELTEIGTYEIYVTAYATFFADSEPSNVEEYVVEPMPSGYTVTLSGEHGGSHPANMGFIYVKINNAPTADNDYDIKIEHGSLTWTNKNGAVVTSLENVTKIYIWAGYLSQYYKIDNGSYIELEGGDAPYYLRAIEINVNTDIILTGKTNEMYIEPLQ